MDINATLEAMRTALLDMENASTEAWETAAEQVANAASAIDGWLSKGGFLPSDWARENCCAVDGPCRHGCGSS